MSSISPKVLAGTLAAASVTIIVWIASTAGVNVPVEVAGALTVIVTFLAGYIKTDPARS
jgi:energy-converting hydrogenase Eha subunit B